MNNKSIAKLFISVALLITVIFFLKIFLVGYTFWNYGVEFDTTGKIGDFIGGIVGTIISAAGFYFLYLTFNDQRKSFEKERLESKFFDLIKLHRDNVSELNFDGTKLKQNIDSLYIEPKLYKGQTVFKVIFNQFVICRNELAPFLQTKKMLLPEYEKKLSNNLLVRKNNIDIGTLAKIDICYSIVFYGLDPEGLIILRENFYKKYKRKFVDDILSFISLKPANNNDILKKWNVVLNRNTRGKRNILVNDIYNWRKTNEVDNNNEFYKTIINYHNRYLKYYGGHQFRLGHYYRHLYQTVKFINKQENVDYKTKYDYIKILRAQLSTHEQAVLFLNSLSKMGMVWEYEAEINNELSNFDKKDFELITKYNLIKNIAGETIYGLDFKTFYPNINYESDDIKKERYDYK